MQDGNVHLRHDPGAAVVVTEVWQLFVSVCGHSLCGLRDSFWSSGLRQPLEPGTVDTAFGPQVWSRGHSPCGAMRKWWDLDLG